MLSREWWTEKYIYCVISDDTKHDVALVYEVEKPILADWKCKLLGLSTVIFFTDGCAGQYKNRKNVYNLCEDNSNFGLNARWVFFTTCHGKQPCDGTGGTVMWLVSNASLKHDLKDQTLSPSDMFQFCKENIQNIIFKFISKADVDNTRVILNEILPNRLIFYWDKKNKFITLKIKQNKILLFKKYIMYRVRISKTKLICKNSEYSKEKGPPQAKNLLDLQFIFMENAKSLN